MDFIGAGSRGSIHVSSIKVLTADLSQLWKSKLLSPVWGFYNHTAFWAVSFWLLCVYVQWVETEKLQLFPCSIQRRASKNSTVKVWSAWIHISIFVFVCVVLQGHHFTIGSELMTKEEDVSFEGGPFYTFSGFNVSMTPRLTFVFMQHTQHRSLHCDWFVVLVFKVQPRNTLKEWMYIFCSKKLCEDFLFMNSCIYVPHL